MGNKILIVDDDEELLDILAGYLSEQGFEVLLAQNGNEFREKALGQGPDLIVLDIMLGDENGVHIYEHLVRDGFSAKTPVIFLSGLAKDRPPSPAIPGRTFALYSKPIHVTRLAEEIFKLLGA